MSKRLTPLLLSLPLLACTSLLQAKDQKDCEPHEEPVAQLASFSKNLPRSPASQEPKEIALLDADQEVGTQISKESLSGVQTIRCGKAVSSAWLACDGKTIVTNLHAILDVNGTPRWDKNSVDQSDPQANKECQFLVEKDGKYLAYHIKKSSAQELKEQGRIGTQFPNGPEVGKDWAVLQFEEGEEDKYGFPLAKFATPSKIADYNSLKEIENRNVIFAAARLSDFRDHRGKNPRAYQACETTGLHVVNSDTSVQTNCRSDYGGSGGPMFILQDKQPLVTLMNSQKTTDSQGSSGTYSVPMTGDLKKAILKHAKSKNCLVPLKKSVSTQASI